MKVDENIIPGDLNGIGGISLPNLSGEIGSGDVPAGEGDAEEEYKKKKKEREEYLKKTTKSETMIYTNFNKFINESLNEIKDKSWVKAYNKKKDQLKSKVKAKDLQKYVSDFIKTGEYKDEVEHEVMLSLAVQHDVINDDEYEELTESINEKVNMSDLKYQLPLSIENTLGFNPKSFKGVKKEGKKLRLTLSSYFSAGNLEEVLKDVNDALGTSLKIIEGPNKGTNAIFFIGESVSEAAMQRYSWVRVKKGEHKGEEGRIMVYGGPSKHSVVALDYGEYNFKPKDLELVDESIEEAKAHNARTDLGYVAFLREMADWMNSRDLQEAYDNAIDVLMDKGMKEKQAIGFLNSPHGKYMGEYLVPGRDFSHEAFLDKLEEYYNERMLKTYAKDYVKLA
tara:strand:+ start:3057 stop:4241 length:1185 start_codon:yes stop_codon:yes gene_type:complete